MSQFTSDLTYSLSEETLPLKSFDNFVEFDDCASTAFTIPVVKSDIKEDSDRVLQTHFVPEKSIILAGYAESIVDEDDPVVNPTSHIALLSHTRFKTRMI